MHWHVQLSGKHEIRSVHGKFSAFQSLDDVLALAAIAFRPEVDGEGLMNNLVVTT